MDVYLILGCNGHTDKEGFSFCRGIENIIADFSIIRNDNKQEIINFLDNGCDLFEVMMTDHNKCVNCITLLYRKYNIITQNDLYKIQLFIKNHRLCGIYLILVLKEDYENGRK